MIRFIDLRGQDTGYRERKERIMAKITGWLCRNNNRNEQSILCFFNGPTWNPKGPWKGMWTEPSPTKQYWTMDRWADDYDLFDENGEKIAPPAPGENFYVEIEL